VDGFCEESALLDRVAAPGSHLRRRRMVTQALWLVSVSVVFGALSGTISVMTGLRANDLRRGGPVPKLGGRGSPGGQDQSVLHG
jgi:hypothetical protein